MKPKSLLRQQREAVLRPQIANNLKKCWKSLPPDGGRRAVAAQCGVSDQYISKVLSGALLPSLDVLLTMCAALDVELSDVVGPTSRRSEELERADQIAHQTLLRVQELTQSAREDIAQLAKHRPSESPYTASMSAQLERLTSLPAEEQLARIGVD